MALSKFQQHSGLRIVQKGFHAKFGYIWLEKKGMFGSNNCEFAGSPCKRMCSVTREQLRSLRELLASLAVHSVHSLF